MSFVYFFILQKNAVTLFNDKVQSQFCKFYKYLLIFFLLLFKNFSKIIKIVLLENKVQNFNKLI